jgi:hypothetical protein
MTGLPQWRLDMEMLMVAHNIDKEELDTPEHNYLCIVFNILSWVKDYEGHTPPLDIMSDWVRRLEKP